MNHKLLISTYKWNRNLGTPEPGYWKNINEEMYDLPADKSILGKKRYATRLLFEEITLPEDNQTFKDPKEWSKWKLNPVTGNSYRMTYNIKGFYMEAEIIKA